MNMGQLIHKFPDNYGKRELIITCKNSYIKKEIAEMDDRYVQKINNLDVYTTGMQKSSKDKLFFMDKVDDVDVIVDFGCADGTLIQEMYKINPNIRYLGYDNSLDMIKRARTFTLRSFGPDVNIGFLLPNEKIENYINNEQNYLLNLSSVIHEVYSYSKPEEINVFWNQVLYNNFKYIAIRDFCVSKSINRIADINDYVKVIQCANEKYVEDYESIWGSIKENRNLVHFLMKYRYKDNWNREVRENYFPITLEQLLSNIPTDKYEIIYFEDYILPFIKNQIKEDFDIDLHDNTHVKLLLKRKD